MAASLPDSLTADRHERRIVLTGIALLALASGSWGLAHVALGWISAPLALGIACAKALLVGLVFMRLATSGTATRVALCIALGFIILVSGGVLSDVLLR